MLRARVAEARLAMLLLTRIPVGYLRDPIPATGASAWGWPLAGAVAMLPAGLIYWALHAAGFGPTVAALGLIFATTLLTGAMHEDGLADVADGFGGGETKAKKLKVMKDSRLGAFGMLAVVFSVGIRAGVLGGLAGPGDLELPTVVLVASRAALGNRAQQLREVDLLELGARHFRIDAAGVRDLGHQPIDPPHVMRRDLEQLRAQGRVFHLAERLGRAAQAGERVLDLMRHIGGEMLDRIDPLAQRGGHVGNRACEHPDLVAPLGQARHFDLPVAPLPHAHRGLHQFAQGPHQIRHQGGALPPLGNREVGRFPEGQFNSIDVEVV